MIKKDCQRGSLSMIAIGFMLFTTILAGAWLTLMTQEEVNAAFDQKQQQAWYAAEAGYTRARRQLIAAAAAEGSTTNPSWFSPNTTDTKPNENNVHYVNANDLDGFNSDTLTDEQKKNLQSDTNPFFAVFVKAPDKSFLSGNGNVTLATGDYEITSVGYFMGERKVLSRTIKITPTTRGGGEFDADAINPVTYEGIIASGGTLHIGTVNSVYGEVNFASYKDGEATSDRVEGGGNKITAPNIHDNKGYFWGMFKRNSEGQFIDNDGNLVTRDYNPVYHDILKENLATHIKDSYFDKKIKEISWNDLETPLYFSKESDLDLSAYLIGYSTSDQQKMQDKYIEKITKNGNRYEVPRFLEPNKNYKKLATQI